MAVPLLPWTEWLESPVLAEHRAAVADAVAELSRRHPARRAFWGDDLAWELGATGLAPEAAEAVRAATEPTGLQRIEVNATPVAPAPGPRSGHPSVLLASTPRAGNTILRQLLVQLGFAEYALHDLGDLHWSAAARPFVVQHHLGPGAEAEAFLRDQRAVALTIVRHPIDVLCSVRAFAQREPAVRYWLRGGVGLAGVDLGDDAAFAEWACSDGADALLAVSTDWAQAAIEVVRYEELAEDLPGLVRRLADTFGAPADPDADPASVAERAAAAIPSAHRTNAGPGAWRSLPPDLLARLADRHARHLDVLGYAVDDGL